MCLRVQLLSARELPTLPMTDPRGRLSVELATEEDRADLGSLAEGVHVYEVGSYEGCACGFQLGEHAVAWSEEDRVPNRASIDALATFLTERAAEGHDLRLAAGWWGEIERLTCNPGARPGTRLAALRHEVVPTGRGVSIPRSSLRQRSPQVERRQAAASTHPICVVPPPPRCSFAKHRVVGAPSIWSTWTSPGITVDCRPASEFTGRRTLTPDDFAAPDFAFDEDGEVVTFRTE